MEKVVIFLKDANVCCLAAAQGDQRWGTFPGTAIISFFIHEPGIIQF